MERIIINSIIVLISFVSMEGVAWFTHKYIMHALLWRLHKDHHKRERGNLNFVEANDSFFLIFALPGIACLFFGMRNEYYYLFWVGLGITLYGLAYFLIHDVFIHQRVKIFRTANNSYFKALRRAHKMHHKHLNKEDGECFGMLWVPFKYFRDAKKKYAE